MSWLETAEFPRRPVVMVEDHLYHITATLGVLDAEAPGLLPLLTVVCLDRPGPDTRGAVAEWLARHPEIRIAAAVELEDPRLTVLAPRVFAHASELARAVAAVLRPGALLLQDVHLETLTFIPRDRWWESIYLASTVRGMFADRPPRCRFWSNKRGYAATFGRDLQEAGFDPRDVLDKGELDQVLIPTVERFLERAMPYALRVIERARITVDTAVGEDDRADIESELDLVLWRCGATVELSGRALALSGKKKRLQLKAGSGESETWSALVNDLFAGGRGLPVLEVGRRVAPQYAGRAEITNCAARHIHHLRSRLCDGAGIRTAEHAYRLAEHLRVGRVGDRDLRPPPRSSPATSEVAQ